MAWSDGDGDGEVEGSKVASIRGVVTGNFWKDIAWGFALGATWGVGKCICKRRPQKWGWYVARHGGGGAQFVGMLSLLCTSEKYITMKNEIYGDPYSAILSYAAARGICERYAFRNRAGYKLMMAWGVGLCLLHGATTILDKQKEKKKLNDQTTSSAHRNFD